MILKTNLFILFTICLFWSCKKNKNTPTTNTPVSVSKPQMSCKINGVENSCIENAPSASVHGFSITGMNKLLLTRIAIAEKNKAISKMFL